MNSRDLTIVLRSAALCIGSLLLLLASEWLFQVTRPSHFLTATWPQRLLVLVASPAAAAVLLTPLMAISAFAAALGLRGERAAAPLLAVSALSAAVTGWMMVSNFTTTIFGVSLFSAQRLARLVLAALLILSIVALYRKAYSLALRRWPGRAVLAASLVITVMAATGALADREVRSDGYAATPARTPNILLVGADGIDAARLSLYGGKRRTSDALDAFARESLVFRNAFPNGNFTAGSTIALLTGRLPSSTGVFHHADLLRHSDAHRHLVGVLRQLGYSAGQFAIVDAFNFNLKESFHYVNGRALPASTRAITATAGPATETFLVEAWRRHSSLVRYILHPPMRLLHYAGPDLRRIVAPDGPRWMGAFDTRDMDVDWVLDARYDTKIVTDTIDFIRASKRPFFVHTFLLATHGPYFRVSRPDFSRGKTDKLEWDEDRFDDAMRETDQQFGRLIEFLRQSRLLDETIVVFYSDHGARWNNLTRIPMIIRFPHGEHRGAEMRNAQLVDVAPTVLDYLGASTPGWMEGNSLIGDPDRCRSIVSIAANGFFYDTLRGLAPPAPEGTRAPLPVKSVTVIRGDSAAVATLDPGSVTARRIGERGHQCSEPAFEAQRRAALLLRGDREQAFQASFSSATPTGNLDRLPDAARR